MSRFTTFKICLLGEARVGKTSVIKKFIEGKLDKDYKMTVGFDIFTKVINLYGDKAIKLSIWDLAGEERFSFFQYKFYKGALGAFIVFDLTNMMSFNKLDRWVNSFLDNNNDAVLMLIGNKVDLKKEIEVKQKKIDKYAAKKRFQYLETSALTGHNIEKAFASISKKILEKYQ